MCTVVVTIQFRDFLFFSQFGVFRDLLQYTHTHTEKRNLFVLYTKSALNNYVLLLCDVIRDLYSIAHVQELMKLLYLNELLYKCVRSKLYKICVSNTISV